MEPGVTEIYRPDVTGATYAPEPAVPMQSVQPAMPAMPAMPVQPVQPMTPIQTTQPVQMAQGVGSSPSSPSSPSMRGQVVNAKMVNGVAVAAPGYIPKAGKLTIEDIEAELALLAERMEFLNNALEELKKKEWCVCHKQKMRFRIPFLRAALG